MDHSNGATEENVAIDSNGVGNATIAPDGPFKLQVQFGICTDPDTEGNHECGYAKVVLPAGIMPTDKLIGDTAITTLGQLPEGYRFMTRQEFADMLAREDTDCESATMPMGNLTFKLDVFG
jgi:hypothetical protein